MGQQLVPERQRQLDQILKEQVFDKITPADTMSGETFKTMSSVLKSKARGFLQSTDYDQRQIGDALNAVVGELRDLAVRNSPQAAQAIKNADSTYAMLLRLEGAAGSSGAVDGVFTPAQLGQSVRRLDTTARKRATATGDALMQDMTTAGREVLGNNVPNSGTADRGLMGLLVGGAIDPMLAGGMIAGRGLYTAPAQRAAASILTQRPQISRQAGDYVRQIAPLSGLAGIEGLLSE
jgi:phage-related tail protein